MPTNFFDNLCSPISLYLHRISSRISVSPQPPRTRKEASPLLAPPNPARPLFSNLFTTLLRITTTTTFAFCHIYPLTHLLCVPAPLRKMWKRKCRFHPWTLAFWFRYARLPSTRSWIFIFWHLYTVDVKPATTLKYSSPSTRCSEAGLAYIYILMIPGPWMIW